MIPQLPVDLVVNDIFTKLPAKTLLCLKSVCKLWYALISDNKFVNLHLEVSIATETNLHYVITIPRLYMQQFDHRPDPIEISCPVLYSADFDTLDNPLELSHPYKYCKTAVWVQGSCRGLLLLCVGNGEPLLLYNPTTQTYNVLPHLTVHKASWTYMHFTFGFGYDSIAKDYKCVRIWQCLRDDKGDFWCEVMVYSLNEDCWRQVSDVPYYFKPGLWGYGALVNENCHWIGTNGDNNAYEPIVVFNIRDETFSSLPLPNIPIEVSHELAELAVGMLDGCLCLSANRDPHSDVWVMKEYGVVGSWTKMFTVENRSYENLERPIGYTNDKKRLFLKRTLDELVYLDLETMEVSSNVMFADCDRGLDAHVYVENLLRLDYAEFADDKKKHGKRKNRKRNRRRRRKKANGPSEKIEVEALRRDLQVSSQQLEMVTREKAQVEADLKSLSDAYNSLEQANFHLEKEVKSLQTGGSTSYSAVGGMKEDMGEAVQKESEVASNSLMVSLRQEQRKVERLAARLLELGEDVDKLLEGTGDATAVPED